MLRFRVIAFHHEDPDAVNRVDGAIAMPTAPHIIANDPLYIPRPDENHKAIGLIFAEGPEPGTLNWDPDSVYYAVLNRIYDVMNELNISFPEPNAVGMQLTKVGRQTGVTSGTIEYTGAPVTIFYGSVPGPTAIFENQILSTMTIAGGDSGSLAGQAVRLYHCYCCLWFTNSS